MVTYLGTTKGTCLVMREVREDSLQPKAQSRPTPSWIRSTAVASHSWRRRPCCTATSTTRTVEPRRLAERAPPPMVQSHTQLHDDHTYTASQIKTRHGKIQSLIVQKFRHPGQILCLSIAKQVQDDQISKRHEVTK